MSNVQTIETNDVPMRDLRGSRAPGKVRFGVTGKILGAIVVVVLAGAVGTYAYNTRPMPHAKPAVSSDQLPTMPSQQ